AGFAALEQVLKTQGQRLEQLLTDVRVIVQQTHQDVLDIKQEMRQQNQQVRDLAQEVLKALEQNRLSQERLLRPSDSLSTRSDGERALVKALVARYRSMSPDQRRGLPALLNAVAKLEVASGEFEAAQRDFKTVAALVPGAPSAQAEAHYNEYQAALEQGQWDDALAAIRKAAQLDPDRFAPFPFSKFEPKRILGAGGFGVAYLCHHLNFDSEVVVKSLRLDGLHRDAREVFHEARILKTLLHDAIVPMFDCDYADPGRTRPFFVMEYFQGENLDEYVRRAGPLKPDELLQLAG